MKITDKLDGAHCCHCRHLKRVVGKKYKERLLEDAMTPRELSPGMEARIERNLKELADATFCRLANSLRLWPSPVSLHGLDKQWYHVIP